MKTLLVVTLCLLSFQSMFAQPPGGRGGPIGRGGGPGGPTGGPMGGPGAPGGGPGGRGAGSPEDAVARLMAFDKNSDAKLTSDELNDTRLQSLLTRADRDGDKAVSKQELITLFEAESKALAGGPGDSGPGGFGPPPGGFGAGEPGGGGPGGFGPSGPGERGPRDVGQRGPRDVRRPGQVLPEPIVQQLQLSKTQVDELAKLQAMVDERLASILTSEQQSQLKEISSVPNRGGRGEGGPGGFGGRSGQ